MFDIKHKVILSLVPTKIAATHKVSSLKLS